MVLEPERRAIKGRGLSGLYRKSNLNASDSPAASVDVMDVELETMPG
jgi:hypothetical protein